MALQDVKDRFITQQKTLGKAALSALYPKCINYYFLSLQLVSSDNRTVDFFSWPVLPDEIREVHNENITVKKTMGGVNVLKNPTFMPRTITMKGDFGRAFKVLIGGQSIELFGFDLSIKNGKFDIKNNNFLDGVVPQFSSFVKNGYGCVKILESMKDKSRKLDENNKPYSLYLYNPILGNNYQVEFNNFQHWQDRDKYNMIPAYSLQLTAIASLGSVLSRVNNVTSAMKNLGIGSLQKSANQVASSLKLLPSFGK